MTNETVEKAKADVKKGMAEVGKAATNLKDDVKADVERLKANFGHNADVEKKADATRILVNEADTGARPDSEEKKADVMAYTEEARDKAESLFGVNAGIVWEALNINGPMTIDLWCIGLAWPREQDLVGDTRKGKALFAKVMTIIPMI
jgi:hypothetical protein